MYIFLAIADFFALIVYINFQLVGLLVAVAVNFLTAHVLSLNRSLAQSKQCASLDSSEIKASIFLLRLARWPQYHPVASQLVLTYHHAGKQVVQADYQMFFAVVSIYP